MFPTQADRRPIFDPLLHVASEFQRDAASGLVWLARCRFYLEGPTSEHPSDRQGW